MVIRELKLDIGQAQLRWSPHLPRAANGRTGGKCQTDWCRNRHCYFCLHRADPAEAGTECPVCGKCYPAGEIETHASRCGLPPPTRPESSGREHPKCVDIDSRFGVSLIDSRLMYFYTLECKDPFYHHAPTRLQSSFHVQCIVRVG